LRFDEKLSGLQLRGYGFFVLEFLLSRCADFFVPFVFGGNELLDIFEHIYFGLKL
jgi:hypothetical protein